MKCPNCEHEMEDKSYSYWSIGDWDSETPSGWSEKHVCNKCKIEYHNGEWKIPKRFKLPTERQIRTVHFINRCFNNHVEPVTSGQCWRYINAHFEDAKKIASAQFEQYCYDYAEYLPAEDELF